MHGMQEVTGSIPVISTNLKAPHRNVWCFCFYRRHNSSEGFAPLGERVHGLQEVTVISIAR